MCDGQTCTAGELVVKAQYINFMQENTKWYRGQKPQQKNIIVPTRTIVHPCLDVTTITKEKNTKSVFNKNQEHKAIQRSTIYLTKSDHDLYLIKSNQETLLDIREKQVSMRGVNK